MALLDGVGGHVCVEVVDVVVLDAVGEDPQQVGHVKEGATL